MAALLALVLAPALSWGGAPVASTDLDAVRAALLRHDAAERVPTADLSARLSALGPQVAPALFSLVTGEGMEELFTVPEGVAEPVLLCSPDDLPTLALSALGELPPAAVIAHLRAREATHPERDVRISEVRVLGALHTAQGLAFLFELAGGFEIELAMRPVRAPLTEALGAILRSDPEGFPRLEELAPRLENELLLLTIEAMEQDSRAAGAEFLGDLLGRTPELDARALTALATLEGRTPWRMHLDVRALLRARLVSSEASVRREVVVALGKLRDAQSFPALIDALGDSDDDVARGALWALGEISGKAPAHAAGEWTAWHTAELEWWKSEGARLREELRAPEPTRFVEALRSLAPRALGRELLAADLSELLPELNPDLQVLACETLAQLGSSSAVPALIDLVFQGEKPVRSAACTALCSLTGKHLPPEPRLWEEFAFG